MIALLGHILCCIVSFLKCFGGKRGIFCEGRIACNIKSHYNSYFCCLQFHRWWTQEEVSKMVLKEFILNPWVLYIMGLKVYLQVSIRKAEFVDFIGV